MNTTARRRDRRRFSEVASVAISIGIAGSCIAGCGNSTGNSASGGGSGGSGGSFKGKTLTLAVAPPTANIPATKKFYADLESAFHKQTGATLKIEETVTSEDVETQMIDRAAVANSGPDMIYMGVTVFPTAYYSKAFATLTSADWKVVGGEDQFYGNELGDSGPNKQNIVGIPLYNVPDAMVYNTKLFKKAGISGPPATWSQFIADAQKVNDPKAGIYGTGMDPADTTDPWKTIWFMAKNYGGDYISKNLKTATVDTAPVQRAVDFWFDWNTKYHIVDPHSLTWQSTNMEAAFSEGKIGELIVQKATDVPLYEAGAVGKNFQFARTPSVPYGLKSLPSGGSAPGTFLSADGVAITKYAPLPLALQFLKLSLSNKMQLLQYKLLGELPATTSAGKVVEGMNPAINGPFVKSMQTQEAVPFSSSWGTVESAMSSVSTALAAKVASGGQLSESTISAALKSANTSVQQQIHG